MYTYSQYILIKFFFLFQSSQGSNRFSPPGPGSSEEAAIGKGVGAEWNLRSPRIGDATAEAPNTVEAVSATAHNIPFILMDLDEYGDVWKRMEKTPLHGCQSGQLTLIPSRIMHN